MRNLSGILLIAVFFVCANMHLSYSQCVKVPASTVTKVYDVNKDQKMDVSYYSDDKALTKIEADTNFDGKPDVIIHIKEGKFDSADADTDNNGTMETKFNNVAEFNKWLNDNHSDFNDALSRADGTFEVWKF